MVSGAANNLSLATIEFTHVNKVDDQYGSEFHDENYWLYNKNKPWMNK